MQTGCPNDKMSDFMTSIGKIYEVKRSASASLNHIVVFVEQRSSALYRVAVIVHGFAHRPSICGN